MVATTRALPLSSKSRFQHFSPNTRHTLLLRTRICRGRGQPATACDICMSLMPDIDGSEGEDNPPRMKRTRRVFPRPTYKASSACALRCSVARNSWEYVVERSPLLIILHEGFLQETTSKFGFHYKGRRSDSARLILPSENQAHFLFRIRYYKRWPKNKLLLP